MDEQIACGLDQIMGGEVFAPDFLHHIPPRLDGLETLAPRITSRANRASVATRSSAKSPHRAEPATPRPGAANVKSSPAWTKPLSPRR